MTHDFELTAFYTIGSLHEFHESNCFQPTRIRLLSLDSQLSIELDRIFPNECNTSKRHFMRPDLSLFHRIAKSHYWPTSKRL